METIRKVAKNTSIILIGKIIIEAISFVTIILLVRYLGAAEFGVYSFVFTYLEFFIIVADLGMNIILVRDIAQNRSNAEKYISNALVLKIILSFIAMSSACFIAQFLHQCLRINLLIYIGSLTLLFSFRNLSNVIFQVDFRMDYAMLINIIKEVLRLALFAFLILLKMPLIWFIVAVVANIVPELFLMVYFSNKLVRLKFEVDFKIWKYLFTESWPIVLVSGLTMIYFRIDQLMLFQMKGDRAVGYYSAAVRLPESLGILPSAFMTSVFPLMSKYFKTSKETLIKSYTLSFKYMFMFIIPMAVGTTILSKQIITLIYGAKFLPSSNALAILIWSEIFAYYSLIHYQIVVSSGQQKLYLFFTVIGALTNVLLNLVLIPKYGIEGASLATVISYALSAGPIIGHLLPQTRDYNTVGCAAMIKPILASLIMGVFIFFLKSYFFISVAAGIIIFILVMFVIKGIDQEDIRLAKALFHKGK